MPRVSENIAQRAIRGEFATIVVTTNCSHQLPVWLKRTFPMVVPADSRNNTPNKLGTVTDTLGFGQHHQTISVALAYTHLAPIQPSEPYPGANFTALRQVLTECCHRYYGTRIGVSVTEILPGTPDWNQLLDLVRDLSHDNDLHLVIPTSPDSKH